MLLDFWAGINGTPLEVDVILTATFVEFPSQNADFVTVPLQAATFTSDTMQTGPVAVIDFG
jgi:hypothetical protein